MRDVPVVDGGELTLGRRILLGLGCDHRVLDGAKAAQFLAELKRFLESPETLLEQGDDA
jgi:pyruvate dehydrogenase E2 component (dihydrolipoamide acetyltransferase)